MSDECCKNPLVGWHIACAAAHFLSAVLLLFVVSDAPQGYPQNIGAVEYAYTCSIDNCTALELTSKVGDGFSGTARQGVIANEFLTALSHVAGVLVAQYANNPMTESWRRWLEYAVTAGVLECAILVSYGVRDAFTLLLVFALNAALQLTGGLGLDQAAEQGDEFYNAQKPLLLTQSFLFVGVQIAFTLTTAFTNATEGVREDLAWSSVLYSLFYLSFGVVQTLKHTLGEDFEKRYRPQILFCVLSLTSKLCLSWHAVSIAKRTQALLAGVDSEEADTLFWVTVVLYSVSGLGIVVYILNRYSKTDQDLDAEKLLSLDPGAGD
jgi:hypothetical protein